MKSSLYILLLLIGLSFTAEAQLYLPTSDYYKGEINRLYLTDSISPDFYNSHLSLYPVLDQRTSSQKLYHSDSKHYYWITQKLFKENFLIFKGEDFWCAVDPILDLEGGSDLTLDSLERMYWNTRGIRVQAKFFDQLAFTTTFYENQAIVPYYQSQFIDNHGEFFPNGTVNGYVQNNGVVPGYARTKGFKQENGYDFAFAEGTVSYIVSKHLNVQLGNGNQFIGNGYRSLLLSDYSVNYPFGKIETNLLDGRLQYNTVYAIHQNLYRIPIFTTPEATYERKIGTYHYLDFALNNNIQIGLFEGTHWKRSDSLGSVTPNPLFVNPIIGLNTLIKGFEAPGFYSILGINATATFRNQRIYGQAIIDKGTIAGYQIGLRTYNLLVPQLDMGIEYNRVELNTYLSSERRYNYGHYNLPLAHPLEAGFHELTANISFQHKRFFINNRIAYSKREINDTTRIGNSILDSKINSELPSNRSTFVVYNQFETGYRFNKVYNLEAFFGHLYRNETSPAQHPLTNYTYIGLRTKLRNKTRDF